MLLIDRFEKTRDLLKSWTDERRNDLERQAETLRARTDEALDAARGRVDGTRGAIEQRVDETRGRVVQAEVQVIETAADLLGWAKSTLGPRAGFVARGEAALREALVELRAGHAAALPIDGFDTLSVKEALGRCDGLDAAALRTLRAYEARHKNRVTLLRELDKRLGAAPN